LTAALAQRFRSSCLRTYVDCVAVPRVVPRHSDFNNLDCQTALSAIKGAKGILPRCKTGIVPNAQLGRCALLPLNVRYSPESRYSSRRLQADICLTRYSLRQSIYVRRRR